MWLLSGRCNSKARLDGKVAIVTGANCGIGKATALDFVRRGEQTVAVSFCSGVYVRYALAHLVEALRCKPEGREFDFRYGY
jgi:NAD(P)-dependent dehydrogenase (short-subunit alcohol dehydrogenase family)